MDSNDNLWSFDKIVFRCSRRGINEISHIDPVLSALTKRKSNLIILYESVNYFLYPELIRTIY